MPFELPINEVDFVSLDLECTGPAPGFDHITEIGAVRFRITRDGVVSVGPIFEELIKPPRDIPGYVTELTGITNEDVASAPPLEQVWPRLVAYLERPNTLLLAHSAEVDLAFLVLSAEAMGKDWQAPPSLCTARVARRAFPKAGKYGLMALVESLGCAQGEVVHHRALADALHARNVFARSVAHLRPQCVSELEVEATPAPSLNELKVDIPDALVPLLSAAKEERPQWIVYRGGSKGRSKRRITPLGFYSRDGRTFLRAWCHLDESAKSFRADRISLNYPESA